MSCTWNSEDGGGQASDGRLQEAGQNWLCCFCEGPPCSTKALARGRSAGLGCWTDARPPTHPRPSTPAAGPCSEANFLSAYLVSLPAFETASRGTTSVTGLLDHMGVLLLIFWGTSILFPQWLYQLTFHQQCTSLLISPHPCQHWCFLFTLSWPFAQCAAVPRGRFNRHCPEDEGRRASFCTLVGQLHVFFGEMFIQSLCPLLKLGCLGVFALNW